MKYFEKPHEKKGKVEKQITIICYGVNFIIQTKQNDIINKGHKFSIVFFIIFISRVFKNYDFFFLSESKFIDLLC